MSEDDCRYGSWLVNITKQQIVYTGKRQVYNINWVFKIWDINDHICTYSDWGDASVDEPYASYEEIDESFKKKHISFEYKIG